MELTDLPNVGKVLVSNLNEIGIHTPEALCKEGSMNVFIKIREQVDSGACLSMLYGIQGAIEGIPYTRLSDMTKLELRAFYHSLDGKQLAK
jgi:DNA transformation protein